MGTLPQISLLGLSVFATTTRGPRSAQTMLIYKIYETREAFASHCYSGHGISGLAGLRNTNLQMSFTEAHVKAKLWAARVSSVLIWRMASFIHIVSPSTDMSQSLNICRTLLQKVKGCKAECSTIPSLKELIVHLRGTVQTNKNQKLKKQTKNNHEIYEPADSGLRATSFTYELC